MSKRTVPINLVDGRGTFTYEVADEIATIEYGDSFTADWGNVGDPRWPKRITMRRFRRNDRGERLIVEERLYERVDEKGK